MVLSPMDTPDVGRCCSRLRELQGGPHPDPGRVPYGCTHTRQASGTRNRVPLGLFSKFRDAGRSRSRAERDGSVENGVPCRGWWRTCGGGPRRSRRRPTGCWRRRTRPRGSSGRRCGWPPTSRPCPSWTCRTLTGRRGSRRRSGTRSCTCCTGMVTGARCRLEPNEAVRGCPTALPGPAAADRETGRLKRNRSFRQRLLRRAARQLTARHAHGTPPRPVALALAGEALEGATLVAQLDPSPAAVALKAPPQPARGRATAPARRRGHAPRRPSAAAAKGRRRAGHPGPSAGRAVGAGGRPAGRPGCAAGPPPAGARRGPPPPPPPRAPWRSIASSRPTVARPSRCARRRASASRSRISCEPRSWLVGLRGPLRPARPESV